MNPNIITDVIKTGAQTWRYLWAGTAPFDVYDANSTELQEEQTENTGTAYEPFTDELVAPVTDEPHALEVVDADATDTPQSVLYPAYIFIQWRGNVNALYYRVQEYVGAAWVDRAAAREDRLGYYKIKLTNVSEGPHTYRVQAIHHDSGESLAALIDLYHVRAPEPPAVDYGYDGADLTVEEA